MLAFQKESFPKWDSHSVPARGHGTIPLEGHHVLPAHPTTLPQSEGPSTALHKKRKVFDAVHQGAILCEGGRVTLKLYVSRCERAKPVPCPSSWTGSKGWQRRLAGGRGEDRWFPWTVPHSCLSPSLSILPLLIYSSGLPEHRGDRRCSIRVASSVQLPAPAIGRVSASGLSGAPDPPLGTQRLPAARLICKM